MVFRHRRKPFKTHKRKTAFSSKQKRAVTAIAKRTIQKESEWKHHAVCNTGQDVTVTATLFSLTAVPMPLSTERPTDYLRIGDLIQPSSVSVRFSLREHVSADATPATIRVIFFQWFGDDTSGVNPPSIDHLLLPTPATPTSTTRDIYGHYNTDYAAQYKIMYDRVFTVDQLSPHRYKSLKLRIPKPRIQYTAGLITGIGNVYIVYLSDAATTSTSAPHMLWNSKLNFRDN